MSTIRLTTAQALVRAMAARHTRIGETVPLFGGAWPRAGGAMESGELPCDIQRESA
jgi:TPP-dependent trihydroxycyclohexane-1,2-dione (THcHDO) dehydratase